MMVKFDRDMRAAVGGQCLIPVCCCSVPSGFSTRSDSSLW